MIDITYGNDFGLRITLRRGSEAFPVTSTSDLTVRLINEAGRGVGLRPRLEDGVIVVDKVDADDVAVGIYGLEVVHRGTSGKWRTMGRNVLRVTYETVAGGSHADAHGDCYDIDVESQVVTFPISATVQSVGIQVQSDWEQTDDTKPDFIKNKPSIPDTSGFATEEWVTEQGYLTQHQDISGKEDRVAVASISGTALAAEVGKYYVGASVETLAVTLPTVADATHLASVVLNVATGASPAVTFTAASGVTISYSKDFALEASKEYEVNCLWNGTKWLITAVEFAS